MIVPPWLLAALCSIALAATGQVLLKLGVQRALPPDAASHPMLVLAAFRHPYVCLGIVLFAASTVIWLGAISGQQLSRVYPMAALGYVLVTVASVWLFHDTVTPGKIAGIALIVLGIVVLNAGGPAASSAAVRTVQLSR